MKVQAGGGRPLFGIPVPSRGGAPETRRSTWGKGRILSAHLGPEDGELCPDGDEARGNLVEVRSGSE
ncbi:hypothetical protein JTE90_014069 [Oedothorax gibbosus]|uniref:Uncharacterized protein n=1 Tax=Oedothorax gibbosus TaxID=931172 RepID=A0AAV6TCC5_9ARAC|nr:hypothetical protein JTE90_014069 [Oedothorax gibbosus]